MVYFIREFLRNRNIALVDNDLKHVMVDSARERATNHLRLTEEQFERYTATRGNYRSVRDFIDFEHAKRG